MSIEPAGDAAAQGPWPASDLVSVSGPSEQIAILQLAARWAERYADPNDDLHVMLRRFRLAYRFLDAVSDGMEPPEDE
jgi:hypothetical protein